MKPQKIIQVGVLIILMGMLANGITKMSNYSEYIEKDIDILITEPDNAYYLLSHSLGEFSSNALLMHFGLFGGKLYLGVLHGNNNEDIDIHFSAKSGSGDLKILLINDVTDEPSYYSNLQDEEVQLSLASGSYKMYLIGSWYSGEFTAKYKDALFEGYE